MTGEEPTKSAEALAQAEAEAKLLMEVEAVVKALMQTEVRKAFVWAFRDPEVRNAFYSMIKEVIKEVIKEKPTKSVQ